MASKLFTFTFTSVQVLAQPDTMLRTMLPVLTVFTISAGRGLDAVVKAIEHAAWRLSFSSRATCLISCGAVPTADLASSSCATVIHQ